MICGRWNSIVTTLECGSSFRLRVSRVARPAVAAGMCVRRNGCQALPHPAGLTTASSDAGRAVMRRLDGVLTESAHGERPQGLQVTPHLHRPVVLFSRARCSRAAWIHALRRRPCLSRGVLLVDGAGAGSRRTAGGGTIRFAGVVVAYLKHKCFRYDRQHQPQPLVSHQREILSNENGHFH